jgi:cytochrome c biogenesis protein CcdA
MVGLFTILLPILVVDILNPVWLGLLIFMAGTKRPVATGFALLCGHTAAYFVVGTVLAQSINEISEFLVDWFNNPSTLDFILGAAIGIFCFYQALRPVRPSSASQKAPEWEPTPFKCFGYGALINVVSIPFALPYFAAIDQILKSDLTIGESLYALAAYNIGYALPFIAIPIIVLVMGDLARPVLEKLNRGIVSLTTRVTPYLLGLLGIWLLFDATYFFVAGTPFFNIGHLVSGSSLGFS